MSTKRFRDRGAIGIGVIGAGWITRAHAHAIHTLNHVAPLSRPLRLRALAARRTEHEPLSRDLGFERFTLSWEEVIADPAVHVVANLAATPGHVEPTLAALAAGKPVLCEKPLAADRHLARELVDAAAAGSVPAACGFAYRYVPAVRLAHDLVRSGGLGRIVHFRGVYLQDYAAVDEPLLPHNGSSAVADYAHLADFLRYFGCAPDSVSAATAKLTDHGPQTDDAYVAALELRGGGLGSLEASRVARGWKGRQVIELNGTNGSVYWNMEDLNRLHVFFADDERSAVGGFRDVLVTQADHPFLFQWWPPGHTIGWEHCFVHQWRDFLEAVITGAPLAPCQASFDDGYEAALVCDAIYASAEERRQVVVDDLRVAEEVV